MGQYIRRRLLQMIPLMIGISLIIFMIIQAAPGGPEGMLLETGRFIDPQVIENYRHRLGVDQPVYVQYYKWITAALTGDFGISFQTTRPVMDMILERLPSTLELMAVSFVFAALIALPLGIYSALHQYSALDFLGTAISFLGIAMPVFWFGLILQLVFSVRLGWLPVAGTQTVGDTSFLDHIQHLILPSIVLSLALYCGMVPLYALQLAGCDSFRLHSHRACQRAERASGYHPACPEKRDDPGGFDHGP